MFQELTKDFIAIINNLIISHLEYKLKNSLRVVLT